MATVAAAPMASPMLPISPRVISAAKRMGAQLPAPLAGGPENAAVRSRVYTGSIGREQATVDANASLGGGLPRAADHAGFRAQ